MISNLYCPKMTNILIFIRYNLCISTKPPKYKIMHSHTSHVPEYDADADADMDNIFIG